MSSTTATISSKNSTMNNNNRKRPISSSIRPSPSPPLAKRHGLSSSSNSRHGHRSERNERPSRSKQQYRHIDNKSSSSESSRSSSNSNHSINEEYSSTTMDMKNANEILSTKKPHFNSNQKSDPIYTKKNPSVALIVKPTSTIDQRNLLTNYDSDEEFERTKQISNQILTKSTHVVGPASVMTIVTTPDLSKKSLVNSTSSTKLVKVVVPQSTSSSIKMLSSGDGLASALRVPTKIQLTKTLSISSTKNDKPSSSSSCSISSTSNHSINSEQLIYPPSLSAASNTLIDIPIDITEKQQQSVVDYHSSTTLPPTPPPPVIDNTNLNVRTTNNQQEEQEKINEISTINIQTIEENASSTPDEHPNDQIKSKHPSSAVSDWSVPPTSELSPTSLTSSSPDLTQNHLPPDDSLVELDSSINSKQTTKRRYHSLSSFPMSCLQTNEKLLKPIKSKSLTRLSNSMDRKLICIQNKRLLTSSPIIKLSSSERIKKRRRDNKNFVLNQKSKTKYRKIESDNRLIIQNLLNEMIERIVSTNEDQDNTLKTLLIKPVPHIQQAILLNVIPNRQTKSSVQKKLHSSSQSLDSTIQQNESRSMIMTKNELDELAYLLHANVQRADYEQNDNHAKVEERMREMWSQMSNQKKNSYYKRVIQIYKRPDRDVVITPSSSSTMGNNLLSSNDFIDNRSLSMNPLSVELNRQTSTPLSFHSIASSTTVESPSESTSKTNIFTDIVNELIKGAKGLDKLSYSPNAFVDSIYNFVRSTIDKQNQIITNLERQVEKKCSTQLNRASVFWKQKINYFATKHQINSSNEFMNELTLIVKYFYLFVLSLNCRKQETEFELVLIDLLNGNLTFIDESFSSPILTNIIDDIILRSSLANDYLASQVLTINQIEYSLPLIRNMELENELLNKNETFLPTDPFADLNDLEDYLNRCEHTTTTIPCCPIQPSHYPAMYYPPYHPLPPQYYYPPPSQTSDMNNYYYNPQTVFPNSPQHMYPYGPSTSYYQPSIAYNNNNNNEQFKYYYNPQQSAYTYSSPHPNSTNDIPSSPNHPSIHRTYRPMNSNIPRTYSNSQPPATPGPAPTTPGTPAVFDATTVGPSQSKSINPIPNTYPP